MILWWKGSKLRVGNRGACPSNQDTFVYFFLFLSIITTQEANILVQLMPGLIIDRKCVFIVTFLGDLGDIGLFP